MSDHENSGSHSSSAILELVFGTKVNANKLSDDAVVKALDFKVEQERTKQQFYRLENITRSIELFKLARELGVPPRHIALLFTNDTSSLPLSQQLQQLQQLPQQLRQPQQLQQQQQQQQQQQVEQGLQQGQQITSTHETASRPPQSYKFPPVGSNLPPKPMSFPVNRAQSPARIGANAVAVLNDSIALKEEGDCPRMPGVPLATVKGSAHVTPHRRNDEYDNDYDSSNDNSHHSHHSHSSNNDVEGGVGKMGTHQRNFSISGGNSAAPAVPMGVMPALSVNKGERCGQKPAQGNMGGPWKKIGMVAKKHRRTKSASSFGVIDLNILESSKQPHQPRPQPQQQQQLQSPSSRSPTIVQQPSPPSRASRTTQHHHEYDEKTCSESSSRNESPVRSGREINSVAKLLNSN